jgi:hypothetical protein
MASLFRYFSARNAEAFIERGEVLFRSLSYFRDYEDAGVRSDEHEGTLVHLPTAGLKVNKVAAARLLPFLIEWSQRQKRTTSSSIA